jgi:hypothetical protein
LGQPEKTLGLSKSGLQIFRPRLCPAFHNARWVQETGDLTPQGTGLRRIFHRTGVIEEFLLQFFRQNIPLHDNRGTQTAKNMFLVFGEVGIAFFSEARIAWPGEAGIAATVIFVRMQRLRGTSKSLSGSQVATAAISGLIPTMLMTRVRL